MRHKNIKKKEGKINPMCLVNSEMNYDKIRLIDENNNVNIVSLDEAKEIAEEADLDLVLVSDKEEIPVFKLLDFEKFLYEQKKKEKEMKKNNKQKNLEIKEMHFSHGIAENDIRIKARKILKLLQKNNKVRIILSSHGRMATYIPQEYDRIIKVLIDELITIRYDMSDTKMEENKIVVILTPKN